MKLPNKNSLILLFSFFIAVIFTGCKEDTVIRAKAVPGIDGINVVDVPDTFTMITKTVMTDTLNTSQTFSNFRTLHALGTVTDPYFGKTTSSVYFQVVPPANSFNFSSAPYTLDSAFIIIPYTGIKWGDTTVSDIQAFTAYEVTDKLTKGETYYSNQYKQTDPNAISETLITDVKDLSLYDSTTVNGINRFPHLRIKLKSTFLQKIAAQAGGSVFDSKASFLDWFKGICIVPDSNHTGKVLPYFHLDLSSGSADYSRASIEFNFHENNDIGNPKTVFFNFQREDCAHYSHIVRNYSGAPAASIIQNSLQNPNLSDSVLLLQNDPGLNIDIRIPYIKNLPIGIINKAQLTLTKLSTGNTDQDHYWGPSVLHPFRVANDGSLSTIPDLSDNDFSFVGGTQSSVDLGGGIVVTQYQLNIPREVQKTIIEQQNELHLRLKGIAGIPAAYSLVAGGRTHEKYKTQLKIVYSRPE